MRAFGSRNMTSKVKSTYSLRYLGYCNLASGMLRNVWRLVLGCIEVDLWKQKLNNLKSKKSFSNGFRDLQDLHTVAVSKLFPKLDSNFCTALDSSMPPADGIVEIFAHLLVIDLSLTLNTKIRDGLHHWMPPLFNASSTLSSCQTSTLNACRRPPNNYWATAGCLALDLSVGIPAS